MSVNGPAGPSVLADRKGEVTPFAVFSLLFHCEVATLDVVAFNGEDRKLNFVFRTSKYTFEFKSSFRTRLYPIPPEKGVQRDSALCPSRSES